MKNFKISFENVTKKDYVPIIKREITISTQDELSARQIFVKEFGNEKKYTINNIEEIKEETVTK